jgi:stress-induced morphogen
MKRIFTLILIGAFLFPLAGPVSAASQPATTSTVTGSTQSTSVDPVDINNPTLQGKTLADKKKAVSAALQDIFNQITSLSTQTQTTINQLNATGVTTDEAQKDLIAANSTLAKAKIDINAFGGINVSSTKNPTLTLNTLKYTAITAETTLNAAKAHIIDSLTSLKASLPSIDNTIGTS